MSDGRSFLFREALASDEEAILGLAEHLATVNLPPEREFIHELLERSLDSFGGGSSPDQFDPERRFLFVLEGSGDGGEPSVVGTSMIHAQHGTFESPHVYFRVVEEERYVELELPEGERRPVHMRHKMLHLGRTYSGPTEVGGLVLEPTLRGHPGKLGRLLSLGRFLYIAACRHRFRDRVLAELLPPLHQGPAGRTRSALWDTLGRKFTDLDYDHADRLSMRDKEFIWKLFPMMPVHASLLPVDVQELIGKVGPETEGARRLLERIGFSDVGTVDPFDGGPHYEAETDHISLVRDARHYTPVSGDPGPEAMPVIVATTAPAAPHFRAVSTRARAIGGADLDAEPTELELATEAIERLGLLDDNGSVRRGAKVIVALRPQAERSDQIARA